VAKEPKGMRGEIVQRKDRNARSLALWGKRNEKREEKTQLTKRRGKGDLAVKNP